MKQFVEHALLGVVVSSPLVLSKNNHLRVPLSSAKGNKIASHRADQLDLNCQAISLMFCYNLKKTERF